MNNAALIELLRSELGIDIIEQDSYQKIHRQLAVYLNELVKTDFDKLVTYLYRIDVPEEKLKTLLHQNPQEDAGNIMASLIIERQLEKIKSREQFNTRDNNIDEEEKW